MKRFLAVLAATLIAPTLVAAATPAAAQTAPRDPVAAVKQQIAKKRGVRIDQTMRMVVGGKPLLNVRQKGLLRPSPRGVTAYDVKAGVAADKDRVTMRIIHVNRRTYVQSPLLEDLPEGKKWVSTDEDFGVNGAGGYVDVLNPKVLKAVLATTKSKVPGGRVDGVRTVAYRGAITLKQLAKANPNLRELARTYGKTKSPVLRWKLWVGARDRLPRRLTTSFEPMKDKTLGTFNLIDDVRLSDWGTRTPVKAPPAGQVIDVKDLASGEEILEEILIPFTDPFKGLKLDTVKQ